MKRKSLFGHCADYLGISNAMLGDIISEHSTRACDEYRAERIRDGREPVPAYAWTALKSLYSEHCPKAEKVIDFINRQSKTRLHVTDADMRNPVLRPVLIRAMLQLPNQIRVAYDPYAPPTVETWGGF